MKPIYLDCHATTPVDERVFAAMQPYFCDRFGNPNSTHLYGWETKSAVKLARKTIADAIGAQPEEIIFTSGATEANNLAIKGIAEAYMSQGKHIITVATEHRAVLDPCRYLESLGFNVTYLPVKGDGLIDLAELEQAITKETILVSVMAANNEIGVLQPLEQIGAICHQKKVLFHSDAAQAIAKIPLDVQKMHLDLMSLTAHKVYGPKGIGALYIRRQPKVRIAAQLQGGGQERGIRSGTLYPPQIVGFAKAVELGMMEMIAESQRLVELRAHLWSHLQTLPGVYLNGHPTLRLPGNLNLSFSGIDGSALLLELQPLVALSSGSACSGESTAPSHVLTALAREPKLARATLRFGIGRFNTQAEIDEVAGSVKSCVSRLREATLGRSSVNIT